MRRVTVIFLTLIIAFGLSAFPASAVDNSQSYLLTLTSGGESVFSVEPGEELEVELKLDRTDRDGSFLMYAFSAGIRYNSSMLELVDAAVLQGVSMTVTEQTGSLNGWSDITLNALSSSINGTEWNDPETILKLKFRASQYGSSTLMIRRASVSTFSGMESFYCETKDAQVNVQKAQEPDHICPSEKYSDLYPEAWYHPAVDYVLDRSYFNGVSDRIFLPDGTMTRAMFVTVLSRLEEIDPALYADNDYSDVADGSWYAAAVQWPPGKES